MYSLRQAVVFSALAALAQGQNIISAQAANSKNISVGLQVDLTDPTDFNIIKTAEISQNLVNQCGRTVKGGNIDVGAKTEAALAAGAVTQVQKGSVVTVTLSANSSMASGTYTCDLDPQDNVQGASGQTALTASQKTANTASTSKAGKNTNKSVKLAVRQSYVARANKAAASTGTMTLTVTMPKDLACVGSSTGNVCNVRCINTQQVGGCFAVQQTDTTALAGNNDPSNIKTSQAADAIAKQVTQNNKDLPVAAAAVANAKTDALSDEGAQNAAVVAAILSADPVSSTATVAAAAATSSAASTKKGKGTKAAGAKAGKNKNNKRTSSSGPKWVKRRSYEVLADE